MERSLSLLKTRKAQKKFLENKDLKMDDRRLRMHSCEESKARREKFLEIKEASKKKKLEAIKKKKADEVAAKKKAAEDKKSEAKAKNDKSTSPSDCIVVCKGFHMNAGSLQEVMKYFYDNHEKVIDVNMEVLRDGFGNPRFDDKAFITFMNKGAADKFKDLAYVRFKGKAIDRFSVQEFKEGKKKPQKGKQEEKAGVKRKLPEEEKKSGVKRKLPEEDKKPVELEKGAAIKIMGIKNKFTKALDVKDKLKNLDVKWEDVVFVNHPKGEEEAQVRLKGEAAKNVAELVKKLNEENIMMGDLVTAARLTGKAEKELDEKTKEHLENYVPKKFKNKKQKK